MKNVRLGILGAGRQGQLHSKNITYHIPGAEVVALADPIEENLKNINIPDIKLYNDSDKIFSDKTIDAVVIASSTDSHVEMIKRACKAKKHIFCEKPIAFEMELIDSCLDAIKESGVKFMLGFNRRYDPSNEKVSRMVKEGAIGQPHILSITSRDPAPPPYEYLKRSGGFFFDTTVHDFDIARYVMHDEIEEVFVEANSLVSEEIKKLGDVDTTMICLKFKSGAVGSINNSRKAEYGFDQRIEVFGSKGAVSTLNIPQSHVEYKDKDGVHTDRFLYFFPERYPESFLNEIKYFVEAVRNDTDVPVSGLDAKISVLLSMAAKESYNTNKPIKIDYSSLAGYENI